MGYQSIDPNGRKKGMLQGILRTFFQRKDSESNDPVLRPSRLVNSNEITSGAFNGRDMGQAECIYFLALPKDYPKDLYLPSLLLSGKTWR